MEKKKIVYEEPLTKVFPIQVKGCFCVSGNSGEGSTWTEQNPDDPDSPGWF